VEIVRVWVVLGDWLLIFYSRIPRGARLFGMRKHNTNNTNTINTSTGKKGSYTPYGRASVALDSSRLGLALLLGGVDVKASTSIFGTLVSNHIEALHAWELAEAAGDSEANEVKVLAYLTYCVLREANVLYCRGLQNPTEFPVFSLVE